jgi:hypothetical protein
LSLVKYKGYCESIHKLGIFTDFPLTKKVLFPEFSEVDQITSNFDVKVSFLALVIYLVVFASKTFEKYLACHSTMRSYVKDQIARMVYRYDLRMHIFVFSNANAIFTPKITCQKMKFYEASIFVPAFYKIDPIWLLYDPCNDVFFTLQNMV